MIVFSIKAPVIPSKWGPNVPGSIISRINQQRTGMGPTIPEASYPHRANQTIVGGVRRMDKSAFGQFVEKVKANFKVGDIICFAHFTPVANALPGMLYRLEAINELWYDCIIDEATDEPRCMFIRGISMEGHAGFASVPGRLRQLTQQEKQLVDLQNSPVHGAA